MSGLQMTRPGATNWKSYMGKTPIIDATLITHNSYYGLGLLGDAKHNTNTDMSPILLGENNDYDIHDRDLTLKKRADPTNQRLGSYNGMLVPKRIIAKGRDFIKRWVYDHYQFGGAAMEYMKYSGSTEFQTALLSVIYGGVITMINPTNMAFPAFTKLCWAMPDIDSSNDLPKKARSADRNPTHAPIVWEPFPILCSTAERKWIADAQLAYARTGKCGPFDHPLQEGAAHLLDAQLQSAAVILEVVKKHAGATTTLDQAIRIVAGAVAKKQGPGRKRFLIERTATSKEFKKLVAVELHSKDTTGLVGEFKNGNGTVHFIDAATRIKEDAESRVFGRNLQPIKPGEGGEIQFQKYTS